MKYMLLCYDDEQAWEEAGPAALKEAIDEAIALTHELDAKGQFVTAAPLETSRSAVSVRIRDGKQQVTDGPFAETNEVLGGYYIIDVDNLDQAIQIAERHSGVKFGAVEIRPILEIPNLPATK
jgi:hypothetical protein